jgi:hypothetical protein
MQLPSDGVINVQHMRDIATSRVSVAGALFSARVVSLARDLLFSGDGPRHFMYLDKESNNTCYCFSLETVAQVPDYFHP